MGGVPENVAKGVALTVSASTTSSSTDTPTAGVFRGSPPAAGEFGLLVTAREVAAPELVAALGEAGCEVTSVAIVRENDWILYIPGAPEIVNSKFAALAPFLVRC